MMFKKWRLCENLHLHDVSQGLCGGRAVQWRQGVSLRCLDRALQARQQVAETWRRADGSTFLKSESQVSRLAENARLVRSGPLINREDKNTQITLSHDSSISGRFFNIFFLLCWFSSLVVHMFWVSSTCRWFILFPEEEFLHSSVDGEWVERNAPCIKIWRFSV